MTDKTKDDVEAIDPPDNSGGTGARPQDEPASGDPRDGIVSDPPMGNTVPSDI